MALLEARPYRPFKSSEEYLYAMKEDLAEWLNTLYPVLDLNVDNFLDRLETGVLLCKHANAVRQSALDYVSRRQARGRALTASASTSGSGLALALALSLRAEVRYLASAKAGTFFARDNVSNFIAWCRKDLGVIECLLFETEDLIARKNEKHVILCLLEVARRGAKMGMLAPMLVQLEREIDREIAQEARAQQRTDLVVEEMVDSESDDDLDNRVLGPMPQIVTNDLKSLDEMVRELVERCQCPTQFPMIRVSEGKYRIGDTKVLIFVRVLRSHVMVRVGGGWDTLSHYLDKHDPCRCRSAHRTPLSAKLVLKNQGAMELNNAQVHYERSPPRTRRSSASSVSSGGRPDSNGLSSQLPRSSRARSRSPTDRNVAAQPAPAPAPSASAARLSTTLVASTASSRARSRSPADPNPNVYSHINGQSLGMASRGRSRSPTSKISPTPNQQPVVAPAVVHKTTLNTTLEPCDDVDFPRAMRLVRPSSQSPVRARQRSLTPEHATPQPTTAVAPSSGGTDSGSEVGSDEGYRSLGVVITPPGGEKRSILANAKDLDGCDIDEEPATAEFSTNGDLVNANTSSSNGTRTSLRPQVGDSTPTGIPAPISSRPGSRPSSRPTSRPGSRRNSCERGTLLGYDIEEALARPRRMAELGSAASPTYRAKAAPAPGGRRSSVDSDDMEAVAGGLRRLQASREGRTASSSGPSRSRSASADLGQITNSSKVTATGPTFGHRRSAAQPSPSSRHNTSHSSWGSGRKPRPALQADTFTRGSPHRSSLPARSRVSRSSGPTNKTICNGNNGSQTNNISPILEQILMGSDLQDDVKVLQKMKDIIQHYAAIVDEKLAREEEQEQLDFTSAWVQGLPSDPAQTAQAKVTPRKDSQPHGTSSRIPAPVMAGKHRV